MHKSTVALALASVLASAPALATTWYVSPSGSDSNAGTSLATAFQTLQTAVNSTSPGDTVKVESGTYTVAAGNYGVVGLSHNCTAAAPCVLTADTGAVPVINSNGSQSGIRVDANYWTVQGFTIIGGSLSMNASTAQGTFTTGAVGILIQGSNGANAVGDVIQNNIVSYEPLSGIAVEGTTDNIKILNNITHDNSWWCTAGGSGISVFKLVNSDTGPVTEVSAVIAGNISYNNIMKVTETGQSGPIDGNGIIIDTTNGSSYGKTTLVENNVVYGNGGSGTHAVNSDNVQFLYNTAYNNNTVNPGRGQIAAFSSANAVVENNVLDAGTNTTVLNATTATVDYNLYYHGNAAKVGTHDIVGNPLFVNPSAGNLRPRTGSPALGAATSAYTVATDILGVARPTSGATLGAYQQPVAAAPVSTAPVAKPAPLANAGSVRWNDVGDYGHRHH